jgi:carbon monoxide dehydrogenase subunit G
MELNGTHHFAAPPQSVWNALHDAAALQASIPGAEQVVWQGNSAVQATIKVGIGPLQGSGELVAQVAEQTPPSHLKFAVNRPGTRNNIQATLSIDLAPDGGGTLLTYQATAQLSGPVAMADNPVVKPILQGQLNQFFSNFEKQVR